LQSTALSLLATLWAARTMRANHKNTHARQTHTNTHKHASQPHLLCVRACLRACVRVCPQARLSNLWGALARTPSARTRVRSDPDDARGLVGRSARSFWGPSASASMSERGGGAERRLQGLRPAQQALCEPADPPQAAAALRLCVPPGCVPQRRTGGPAGRPKRRRPRGSAEPIDLPAGGPACGESLPKAAAAPRLCVPPHRVSQHTGARRRAKRPPHDRHAAALHDALALLALPPHDAARHDARALPAPLTHDAALHDDARSAQRALGRGRQVARPAAACAHACWALHTHTHTHTHTHAHTHTHTHTAHRRPSA
jgi:hypothetical protein